MDYFPSRVFRLNIIFLIACVLLTSFPNCPASESTINTNIVEANWELASEWHPLNVLSLFGSVRVQPTWLEGSTRFWYSYRTHNGVNYWLVEPDKGSKIPLFDMEQLVMELQDITGDDYSSTSFRLADLSVMESGQVIEFSIDTLRFRYHIKSATLSTLPYDNPDQLELWHNTSPDSTLSVYVKANNLYLTDLKSQQEREIQLTDDGSEGLSWGTEWNIIADTDSANYYVDALWSADSRKFAVLRADLSSVEDLYVTDFLHQPRPKLKAIKYPFPCEQVPQWQLWVYNHDTRKINKVDIDKWPDQTLVDLSSETLWWSHDSSRMYFIRKSRDHKSVDVCVVDPISGKCSTLIEEYKDCQMFIHPLVEIPDTGELLWWSMRDGSGHYYLYSRDGEYLNQVTSGALNALEIVHIDSEKRKLYFYGNKIEKGKNPYYKYLYRVDFDGSRLTLITPDDADHRCFVSQSGEWIVDNYSRVELPTRSILRDTSGRVVMELETTNIETLEQEGWQRPKIFSATAADGITELWGVMYTPYDLDTTKDYPVITRVYPGRETEGIPTDFWPVNIESYLAQFGFIVVQFGNRGGSPYRGMDYWKYGRDNFRDYGLEDKKVVIEQLASKYDYIDLNRVGIFGGSSGGFMTVSAMLTFPDFFKVGAAMTAPNDPGLYYNIWFERYHGFGNTGNEIDQKTIECDIPTNIELAGNLKGRLLLIYGSQDELVHLAQLFRMADAFINEGKVFDMFVIPGAGHQLGDWRYVNGLVCEYFIEHLLGDKRSSVERLIE